MKELIRIQSELKAPKGQYNSFGKYNYRSAEDILEAVKPLLKENDCILTLADDVVEIGGRIYVKAVASLRHDDEIIQTCAFARESETKKGMDDSQITGTASSYARKYALNGLFLIDDTKDADTDEYKKQNQSRPPKDLPQEEAEKLEETINKDEAKMLIQYSKAVGWQGDDATIGKELCKHFGVEKLTEITQSQRALFIKEQENAKKDSKTLEV